MTLEGLRVTHEPPVGGQQPSADVLFESMSSLGSAGLGVILTGMGGDGAEGLRKMREAGAYTIAEDVSTAVVYGMPEVAVRLQAQDRTLTEPAIEAASQRITASVAKATGAVLRS